MLELRRLALLHQFAGLGSIAATASATGYSASAVSQQLAVLEREVGVALLERSPRSAALTEAGVRLARHAAIILDAVETAEAELADAAGDSSGRIVVSSIPTVAITAAPRLIRLNAPQVVLRQHTDVEALELLRTRQVDIAIVDAWRNTPPEPGLIRIELMTDPLLVAGRADHTTWLVAPPDQLSRQTAEDVMAELGIEPLTRWEFMGLTTIADLVATGAGAAVLPRMALRHIDVPTTPTGRFRRIDAVIRASSQVRPAVRAVIDALSSLD
ncbi:LysR family transcriptional regulator [Nocardia brasiliensis]|uniref:LysR family transcriptional regulator n=1 Tax=Nocardia brasiliensis TaxID=37326 RepID=UPI003D93CA21